MMGAWGTATSLLVMIIVSCRSGQRVYTATRMLLQYGSTRRSSRAHAVARDLVRRVTPTPPGRCDAGDRSDRPCGLQGHPMHLGAAGAR